MYSYFFRRFLMIFPTFIGITFLCFTVTRFVPGGPVEQAILRYQQARAEEGEAGGGSAGLGDTDMGQISEEMMAKLNEIYGFNDNFVIAYIKWLMRVIRLDLGQSDTYDRPVWELIVERLPISISFGLTGFILSYLVCIPLGVWKAVKHGSHFDTLSSITVFVAYSIPGWTAGVILLMLLGGGTYLNIVPLGGIRSADITPNSYFAKHLQRGGPASALPEEVREEYKELRDDTIINESHKAFSSLPKEMQQTQLTRGHHEDLTFWGRILDRVWHLILPVFCYVLGLFASKTVLMKNSLMENLGQDYVRTAFAKGLSERVVIFKHAFRNSLIPIATGLGHMLSIVLAGSYLIEKVFNINGFGLLGYDSLIARDYPVTLGILVIGSFLRLFGNIMSDLLYCIIDPRIRFS